MNKLKYKLTHTQAQCLCDCILNNSNRLHGSACCLLASTVAIAYSITLSRKLILKFQGKKTFSLSFELAIALFILIGDKRLDEFTPLEAAVVLPILQDAHSKIINAP